MSYIGEQITVKHTLVDDANTPVSPASAQYRVQLPNGSELALQNATVNASEISFTITPQVAGTYGYTIIGVGGTINTGYFNVIDKKGLTPSARSMMDSLQSSVSIEVDEYLEKDTDPDDQAIPYGDIAFYLHEGAKEVIRRLDRMQALDLAKKAIRPHAIIDTTSGKATIPVPADYYRFLSLDLSSFNKPATEFVSQNSSAYRLQQFKGRRGTPARPFVTIIPFEGSFQAETVPDGKGYFSLSTHPSKGEYVISGDYLTDGVSTGNVSDLSDEEFIIATVNQNFTVGSIADVQNGAQNENKNYKLKSEAIAGSVVTRSKHGGKAIECYPHGSVNELWYVPLLKAYEIDAMYHLAMIKFATHKVFMSMRKAELAKFALEDFALMIQSFNTGQRGES